MTPAKDTIFRLALPILGAALVLIVAKYQNLSFQRDLGLHLPSWKSALWWVLLFVGLVMVEELVANAWGLPQPEPWGLKYQGIAKISRVFALVVIAPVSEELVFRGMLYHTASTTPLKDVGAILVTALLFAAFHFQYSIKEMLFILVDGLFYGVVRCMTGSTMLTMGLHLMGNSYAAYQRLFTIGSPR